MNTIHGTRLTASIRPGSDQEMNRPMVAELNPIQTSLDELSERIKMLSLEINMLGERLQPVSNQTTCSEPLKEEVRPQTSAVNQSLCELSDQVQMLINQVGLMRNSLEI